jgi:hypothetical protein
MVKVMHWISGIIMPIKRELSLEHAQRCSFLIMEQSCGPLAVEFVPGKHWYFGTYLAKRTRAQFGACAEVQISDYGTVLWPPGSLNGSRFHCVLSTYIAKRASDQSGACAQVQFPDYGTVLCSLAVEKFPGKHFDFSTYLAKGARAQSGACAEVQFHDYGTDLWSSGCRNYSRKALRFQLLSCQETESSVFRMRRGAVS